MPSVIEARVARAKKINYDGTNLAALASDFYLLETLANVKEDPAAKRKLSAFEADLAQQFSSYLDIAIGGELRYARSMLGDDCPKALKPFIKEAALADRGTAWIIWTVIRRAWGLRALAVAQETFEASGWRGSFGGEAWAGITKVLRAYMEGRINNRVFVDRCWSLEHNSNVVFDKLWSTRNVRDVLDAHGRDCYETLLNHASEEVGRMWDLHHRRKRRAVWESHDPIWLGAAAWEPEIEETLVAMPV